MHRHTLSDVTLTARHVANDTPSITSRRSGGKRAAVLAAGLALAVMAGCSSHSAVGTNGAPGAAGIRSSLSASGAPTSTAPGSGTPAGGSTPGAGAPSQAAGSSSTAAGSHSPASAATGRTATTTAPKGGQTATSTAPSASGPAPAAPGTYRYHQVGTLSGTPSQGTLVVSPASASGTQTWTRVVGGSMPTAATVMRFDATGAYLVAPSASASGAQAACTFPTPLPWPVWPTTVGRTVSGQATCHGAVSSYLVTETVQGTQALPLDGATVMTSEVVNTITMAGSYNGSPLKVTMTETDYYAPTLRVPVKTTTHLTGSVLGFSVATDRTDTLLSATPS